MQEKGHLISKSFEDILSLRFNLNLGISDALRTAFPNITPVSRPEVPLREIFDSHWLTGFIDGEGCFMLNVKKHNYKTNNERIDRVWLTFQITQHSRDIIFKESIIKYLNCGRVKKKKL